MWSNPGFLRSGYIIAIFHSSANIPSVSNRLMIFVSSGSKGVAMSLSIFVGNASNLQDLVGIDIMIFSTLSSVRLVKFSRDLLLLCWVGLNFGEVSSASLIFLILFMKNVANSSANSSLFLGGWGIWIILTYHHVYESKQFLVSLPASMTSEDIICVFALLIMAKYFSSPLSVLSIDVWPYIFSRFFLFFILFAFAVLVHLWTVEL